MLTQKYNKILSRSKFQKASIWPISHSQSLATLGRQIDSSSSEEYGSDCLKYQFSTYISNQEEDVDQVKNCCIFDVKKENH